MNIVSSILHQQKFPTLWKMAEVRPIAKCSNPTQLGDYRPISLLYHLSKVAEKVINNILRQEISGKLNVNQYAYTAGRSTTDALVYFVTKTAQTLDNKNTQAVQTLLLDFSKAFDRMDH